MHLSKLTLPALAVFASAQAQKLKFMPFGDSITEITCWRALVQDQLMEVNLMDKVDFVGSKKNNAQNCATETGTLDTGHEGHSGWEATAIAENYITEWAEAQKPDIVNFHLGTNDLSKGHTPEEVIAAYDTILKALRAANPNVKVIIDKLIAWPEGEAGVKAVNDAIPAWVKKHQSEKSPISTADCSAEAGYKTSFNRDGVHPNEQGDEFIASKIGPVLIQYVEDSI